MTDCKLYALEQHGEMLIKSEEFYGVHYSVLDEGIKIYAGKDGSIQVGAEYIDIFLNELSEIITQYQWKWCNGK